MIVHQFPDIHFVKSLRNDVPFGGVQSWKNIALNIKCKQVSRVGVESPYSLFLNRVGSSFCDVNRKHYRIETDQFLFTKPGEQYDLLIDNLQQTEIFNIHINKEFFEGWARVLTTPHAELLDAPDVYGVGSPEFFTQLYPKDATFNRLIEKMHHLGQNDEQGFEVLLGELIQHLLLSNEGIRKRVAQIPAAKSSVQKDIYSRLIVAKDFICSNYNSNINLDELCRETALSKFHFLRLFKSFYGVSPYQYLTKIRMEKAATWLKTSGATIGEISDELGFEYPSSFIKSFHKTYGVAPLQFRKAG